MPKTTAEELEHEVRTTSEVIETLAGDCERCHQQLIDAIEAGSTDDKGNHYPASDYDFFARQLVRAAFAYIEALTFSVKASSAYRCIENGIEISPQERYFSIDTEFDLNDKGEIIEAPAKISLAKNVRFALALKRKAAGIDHPFDASTEWWSCLKKAIRIRDRLTHPKLPGDLDLSGDDVLVVLRAKHGFELELLTSSGAED